MSLNLIPRWLTKLWDTWDVRIMVLFSLAIQVILFFLGSRRKYDVKSRLRIILWLAYLMADWIATAALGKLSEAQAKTNPVNVLRALWAPMLLVHLGGPDTITAYVLEDNLLWKRHLLGLLVEVYLVIYVLILSFTRSWLSFVTYGLMFIAGLIKYIERTLSLMVASSGQAEKTIPVFQIDTLVESPEKLSDEDKLVLAYQFFSAFRPDITNYISPRENISSSGTKLLLRFMNNVRMTGLSNVNMDYLLQTLDGLDATNLYEILEVELEFMFDVLYTKAPVTYTKLGCFFRFISVCFSACVLTLFLSLFRVEPRNHYSMVDIIVTCILLVGAIMIELYAIGRLVYSDWTLIWINSGHSQNHFVCWNWILGVFLSLLRPIQKRSKAKQKKRSKRWSESMGQFNLVSYCFKYKKEGTDIWKWLHRHQHTKFKGLPDRLKKRDFSNSISSSAEFAVIATRGEKALKEYKLEDLKWSIELDFDESIITWHLVTDFCYYANDLFSNEDNQEVKGRSGEVKELKDTCQMISNYMMYLLVMQSDMIIPGYRKDFWFSHVSETLGGFFEKEKKSEKNERKYYTLIRLYERMKSRGASELEENALKILRKLGPEENRWEIIEAVWLEMLCYAAVACQHVNHARQLRRGGEYLTHLWLHLTMAFLKKST